MRLLPRTLRGRVAAAAAAAIVLAVAVLGAAVLVLVDRELAGQRDDALRDGAAAVARLNATAPALVARPGGARRAARRAHAVRAGRRSRRAHRRPLERARRPASCRSRARSARPCAATPPRRLDARLGDERLRVLVAPLATAGAGPAAGGAVVVATRTDEDERTLDRLRLALLVAAVAAAVLAAAGALVLTRRALRPLARLSSAARDIEATGDPSRRLPHPATRDELATLADTLNAMLAALERARERERRFVADASHELRTPLTALRGNAGYVARHGADPEALADLERDAARLARLLDDLLALAREDAGTRPAEPVDLAAVARDVAAAHAGAAADAPGPAAVARRRRGAAPGAGEPRRQRAALRPPGGRIALHVRSDDGRVRAWVDDDGPGLAADEARQAFERFWRGAASADVEGSGLGLALVLATAERHGGTARVEDGRVVVDLPALTALSTPPATTPD